MEFGARDLTIGSIPKNLIRLSLPIMLSNFMQTFYNLTDAFWLGKLSENAPGAVSTVGIAFPIIFFLASFGFGFVIAGTAIVARYKGAGEIEKIKAVVGQFVLILILFSAVFLLGSMLFIRQILTLLRVPGEIFEMACSYTRIILIGATFMFVFMFYQSIAHGLGDTLTPMKIQVVSVSLNVILDPLLIFGVGFLPQLGTVGAAYATLTARIVAAIMAIAFIYKNNKSLIPKARDIMPKKHILKNIVRLSIPASIGHSMTSFGFIFLQGFVNTFGTVVISTYTIGMRMTSFFMMPAMGISQALSSVIGQNLGAKKVGRAEKSFITAFVLVMAIMTVGSTLVFLFGAQLVHFFIDDPGVIETGTRMFKITAMASWVFAILFVFMGVFNGAGQTTISMIINIGRLWMIRIPLVFLLSGKLLGVAFFAESSAKPFLEYIAFPLSIYPYDSLWWSMLISNVIMGLIAFSIYKSGSWKRKKID